MIIIFVIKYGNSIQVKNKLQEKSLEKKYKGTNSSSLEKC